MQFAHWMGYFLMSIPAGWLATRLGYKGGIIAGLLLVAVGGFWFIPASRIAAFWAFSARRLRGRLRPDVPGDGGQPVHHGPRPPATPPHGSMRRSRVTELDGFSARSQAGGSFTAPTPPARAPAPRRCGFPMRAWRSEFSFWPRSSSSAPVPDIKAEDDYQLDDKDGSDAGPVRQVKRGLSYLLLLGKSAALVGMIVLILWRVFKEVGLGQRLVELASAIPHPSGLVMTSENSIEVVLAAGACVAMLIAAVALVRLPVASRTRASGRTSISQSHAGPVPLCRGPVRYFSLPGELRDLGAAVAAVCVDERREQMGRVPNDVRQHRLQGRAGVAKKLTAPTDSVSEFLASNISDSTRQALTRLNEGNGSVTAARVAVTQDLNSLIAKQHVYAPQRFSGIALSEKTKQLLAQESGAVNAAQQTAPGRRLSEGAHLSGRRHRRDQQVGRHAGIAGLCLFLSRPGRRRGPGCEKSPHTGCSGSTA